MSTIAFALSASSIVLDMTEVDLSQIECDLSQASSQPNSWLLCCHSARIKEAQGADSGDVPSAVVQSNSEGISNSITSPKVQSTDSGQIRSN